jgi:site-specific recombinase XerC
MSHVTQTSKAWTAQTRYRDLQQFFRWQVELGELDESPMQGLMKPRLTEEPVPIVAAEDLAKLFKACAGKSFEDRRDRPSSLCSLTPARASLRSQASALRTWC